jgi:hypothetical protein
MPSTYTLNNGIELIATGEQSGTWGDTTNVNFGLIDTALDGQVTVTLFAAGTSGAPNALPISDGAASNGRNRLIIFADGGDLGATAFVQLTPNDAEKIVYIRNNLSGGRSITLFQGTYNASNDYEVPAGTTAIVFFNGGGAGAVAANVFNNAYFDSLRLGGVSVTAILDEDNMASDSATALATQQSIKAYVDAQVGANNELSEVLANGNTSGGTNIQMTTTDEVQFRDAGLKINSSVDGQLDIAADVELEIVAPTVDINASTAVTIDTATLTMTGSVNVVGDLDVDNLNLNGNTIISTNTNGNIALTPNGTGEVDISKVDIDGGTIDGVTIGGASAGAGTFTSVTGTSLDMNGNADFSGLITLSQTGGTTLRRTDDAGYVVVGGGTSIALGSNITLHGSSHPTSPNYTIVEGDSMFFRPVDNNPEFLRFVDGTGAVFNEEGADHDFRIESDTNANAFFLQGSNGYVGISTASPLQPLHVNSSGNTQLLVSSSFNNSTNTGLTVDTVGDSSAFRLNVTKSGAVQGTFRYLHAATSADQAWEFAASGSVVYKAGYAEHIWKTGNTERLRINSSGNVGIGTDSPAQKLDVNGTIKGTGFSTASTTNPITYMDQNVVWAPTFLSSGGGETISYTVNSGQYCRYGEWVTCAGRIVVASVSGGSGSTYIGGLPFTTVNSSIAQGTLQVGTSIGFVTKSPEMGGTLQNTVTCLLKYFDGSQAASFSWSEIQAGSTLFFTIIYRAA